MDDNLISQALPYICQDLQLSSIVVQWLNTIGQIASAGSSIPFSNLGRRVGFVNVLIASHFCLAVVYIMPLLVKNFYGLLVIRFLQGLCLSAVNGNRSAMFMLYPVKESIMSVLKLSLYIGSLLNIFSPLIISAIIQKQWQYAFIPGSILSLLSFFTLFQFKNKFVAEIKFAFDYLGTIVLLIFIALFCVSLVWITSNQYLYGGIGFLVSLLLIPLFLFIEYKVKSPILPLALLRKPYGDMMAFNCITYLKFVGNCVVLPFYFKLLEGISPFTAGIVQTVVAVLGFLATMAANLMLERFQPRTVFMTSDTVVFVFGIVAILTSFNIYLFLVNYFIGIFFEIINIQALYIVLMRSVPREHACYVSGLPTISRCVGSAVTSCMTICCFTNLLSIGLNTALQVTLSIPIALYALQYLFTFRFTSSSAVTKLDRPKRISFSKSKSNDLATKIQEKAEGLLE